MRCSNCGSEIPDNSKFCLNCGFPVEPPSSKQGSQHDSPAAREIAGSDNASTSSGGHGAMKKEGVPDEAATDVADSNSSSTQEGDVQAEHALVDDDEGENKGNQIDSSEDAATTRSEDNFEEVTAFRNVTTMSSGSSEESKAQTTKTGASDSKQTKRKIEIIASSILLPPLGIFLIWKWMRGNKNKKVILTVVLAIYALFFVSVVAQSIEISTEEGRVEASIQSDKNLGATFQKDGVIIRYPKGWSKTNTGAFGDDSHVGFSYIQADAIGVDKNNYNLSFKTHFDDMCNYAMNKLAENNQIKVDKNQKSSRVLDNAMVCTFPVTMTGKNKLNDTDSTLSGTFVIYSDSANNLGGVFVFHDNEYEDFSSEMSEDVDSVVKAIEFSAPDYKADPTKNPVTKVTAKYSGSTEEGTVLNQVNSGITVIGTFADGTSRQLTTDEWKMTGQATLKAGESSTIHIVAGDVSTDLTVKCTSMTMDQFKATCQDYSYSDLLRNPDDYLGKSVHFHGKVMQALEDGFLVEVTDKGYGIWDDIVVIAWDGKPNVIEDDIVDVYGTYTGAYTYQTAIGAQKTVPSASAKAVSIG